MSRTARWAVVAALVAPLGAVATGTAHGQQGFGRVTSSKRPIDDRVREGTALAEVDVEEHLGAKMPLDLAFTDHRGRRVVLGDLVRDKPVVLTFNYFTCPVLCSLLLEAAAKTLSKVPWTVGDEYDIVTISIDPHDTPEKAAEKRAQLLETYGKSDGGWHFLLGSERAIERAAEAAGIRYTYDEEREQYAHPAVITVLTPGGKLARYLYGLQLAASDIRLALFEAADGNTLSTSERVILSCYSYDPAEGSYALVGWRIVQLGGGASAVGLVLLLGFMWRRERRRERKRVPGHEEASEVARLRRRGRGAM